MPAAGDVLGKWKLIRPLGSGGFGQVWLAQALSEQVAIKVLDAPDRAVLERFASEAALLRELKHPSIVAYRGSGAKPEQDLFFLAMELVQGADLEATLMHGPLAHEAAQTLFRDLADGLRYAHLRGVFHRDLKPQNVMVRPDGSGCLIDFGIARRRDLPRLTAEGFVPGTVAYLPPEVFREGVRGDEGLADVYALGLMLYESLVGRRAFAVPTGTSDAQGLVRIGQEKLRSQFFDPGPNAPGDLRDLVRKATDPDPDLRLASMERFAERLGARASAGAVGARTRWIGPEGAVDPGTLDRVPGAPSFSPPPPPPPPPSFGSGAPVHLGSGGPAPLAAGAPIRTAPERGRSPLSDMAGTVFSDPMKPAESRGFSSIAEGTTFFTAEARDDLGPEERPAPPTWGEEPPVVRSASDARRSVAPVVTSPVARPVAPVASPPALVPTTAPTPPVAAGAPLVTAGTPTPPAGAGLSAWLPLLIGAAALALLTMVAALGAVYWVWRGSGDFGVASAPPAAAEVAPASAPVATRLLQLVGLPEGASVWVDGVRKRPDASGEIGALPVGAHAVTVGVGADCASDGACCAKAEGALDLPAGDGAFPWTAPAPTPLADHRALALQLTGVPAARWWINDKQVPAGKPDVADLPLGPISWRVEVGSCPASAHGCTDSGACPPGCSSRAGTFDLVCGHGPATLAVSLDAPMSEAPSPSAATTPAPADPKVKKPKEATPVEAAPAIEQRLVTSVSVGSRSVDKGIETSIVDAVMDRKQGAIAACYEKLIAGKPSDRRTVVVDFKVDRSGEVDRSSVFASGSSGSASLDACVISAVKGATFSGVKKPGPGRVSAIFEAQLQ